MKKLSLLFILSIILLNLSNLFGQATTPGNIPAFSTDYLGWYNSATQALTIKNEANYPINFHANTGAGGTGNLWMTILGGGNVGINTTAPAYKLDVTGDINISTNQVYRIGGKPSVTPTALILKAIDSDNYFEITVNKKGKIKATPIKKFS